MTRRRSQVDPFVLHAGGNLFYDGDITVTSRPSPVRVLMAEALWHAFAGSQRRMELRMAVVVDDRVVVVVMHPLDELAFAHTVLDVQWHV